MNDLNIRTMRPDEISLAVDWAAAEGWNPGLADAACFASVDPEGFFIAELDGAPVATISCVNYDARFSFLGFYIVREELRGKGSRIKEKYETEGNCIGLSGTRHECLLFFFVK